MVVVFLIMAAEVRRACEMVVLSKCLHTCQQACPKKLTAVILIFALRIYDEVDGLHASSKDQAETYILYLHVSDGCSHPFPSTRV